MGVIRRLITVTPVMANAGAYVANDQVGLSNEMANAAADTGGLVEIDSLTILDKAKQSLLLDVFFFDRLPSLVAVDNAEFEMTDANFILQCRGVVKVATADYCAQKNASMAQIRNVGLFVRARPSSKSLWCVVVTRGTPTYASLDLQIEIGCKTGGS